MAQTNKLLYYYAIFKVAIREYAWGIFFFPNSLAFPLQRMENPAWLNWPHHIMSSHITSDEFMMPYHSGIHKHDECGPAAINFD